MVGARVGWAGGPLDGAVAYGQVRAALAGEPEVRAFNVGASYDLRLVKLFAQYHHETNAVPAIHVRENRYVLGASVPVGAGEIHASYVRSDGNPGPDASQIGLGYVYNLSKRTAVYSTVSTVRNNGSTATGGNFSVAYGSAITALPTRGGDSRGAEFGVRHFF